MNRAARVVVVGSGRMGQIRAAAIRSNHRFELSGIVDPPHFAGARELANKFGVTPYGCLSEAIQENASKERALDALIVSSPTDAHESIIKQACDQGVRAVFTEKPVDETAEKIQSLFDYTDQAGVHLCCGFQRRFDPSYVAATEAVMSGQVGTPVSASIFFADHPVPPKAFLLRGGDIYLDLCAHDVDYIMYTLQDDIVSVYATGSSSDPELAAAGVHDNATMVLKFRHGAVVTLFMSRSAVYGYDQRCEIYGTEGLVSVENVHENTARVSNLAGVTRSRLQHSFPERFKEAFALEMDAFADTILFDKEWPVTADQCIRVQRVADAAQLSAATGRVIEIDPYFPPAAEDEVVDNNVAAAAALA